MGVVLFQLVDIHCEPGLSFTFLHAPALAILHRPYLGSLLSNTDHHYPTKVNYDMRPGSLISYALLLAPAACRVVPMPPQQNSICNLTSPVRSFDNRDAEVEPPSDFSIFAANPPPGAFTTFFEKYRCRGHKLWKACMFEEDRAREFVKRVDTPFDSTLEKELALWGYTENEVIADSQCEFDLSFELEFKALGVKAESKENNGPNECFWWQHWDDDKKDESGEEIPKGKQNYVVNDKTYRVSALDTCRTLSHLQLLADPLRSRLVPGQSSAQMLKTASSIYSIASPHTRVQRSSGESRVHQQTSFHNWPIPRTWPGVYGVACIQTARSWTRSRCSSQF